MNPIVPTQRTRIKICGLTREQDVDAAVAAGADAIGLVMYPKSPRHVSVARAAELALRLPPFVTPVLLFVNATPGEVSEALDRVPGAILQFHGDETAAECHEAARDGRILYIRAARVPLDADAVLPDLVKYAADFAQAAGLLLDAHVEGYGGGGKTFNWSLLPPSVDAHLVLSGGLTPANVADGIAALRQRGRSLAVDVSSGVEASKGIKDAGKIAAFIAAVRAEDARHAGDRSLHS